MTRVLMGVVGVVAGLSGCASPARYVERGPDSGVVAIPANTDAWPSYHRREAMALIQRHLGHNYEIVEEREVATGQRTYNDQQVKNEETFNTSNPLLLANKQTVNNTTTTTDITEWRIAYRLKPSVLMGGASPGMPPGSFQQTQYQGAGATGVKPAGGIVPSAGPGGGVVPVGGSPLR